MKLENKVKDGIIGLVVGDALGVPHEFSDIHELKANPVTTMTGYGTWNKPPGSWSDDTSMTLATLNSITKNNGQINYDGIMQEFVRWIVNGDYTQNGEVFDYGVTTGQAIENYALGIPPVMCGGREEHNNGNGSLMRILPLAWTDADYETISDVSSLTHATDRCKIACNLYIELARQIISDTNHEYSFCDHVATASELIQEYYYGNKELEHYQRIFDVDYTGGVQSSGYVVNTLECAIYCIREEPTYHDALLRAVNLGGDTDTVGAVCGGLAGLYYGFEDIPSEWIDTITGIDYVYNLIDGFSKTI